jgi:iron complex outermembrane receptor protein
MKKHGLCRIIALMVAGLILGTGGVSVMAQDSGSDDDTFMLEEVTVTAQKRSENQQKVAIAMDVISGDDMKELGQTSISQILSNVSSATVNKTGSYMRISIRGVSDDLADGNVQTTTPTAAINTDGVMTNRNQTGTGFFDVERVEVLVGPQSTLYASASPGGIVNVVTASPKLEKLEGSVTLEYGSYDLMHGEGALNIPLGESFALRASGSAFVRDGYNSNGGDDQDQKSGRLKAMYQPNEKFSFMVTGEYSKESGHGFGSVDEFDDEGDKDDPWTNSESTLGNEMEKDGYKIYGNLDYDFGAFALSITPSYNESSSPSSSAGTNDMTGLYTVSTSTRDSTEKSVEARLTSSEDFLFKWIAGALYYKALDESLSDTVTATSSDYNNILNEDTVKAFYGNITYPVTEAFRATAGIRYTDDFNHSYQDQTDGPPDVEMPTIVDQPYKKASYKFGLEYDVNDSSMVYADISTAYRTQGMAFDADGNVFPPEELTAFNLGAKNRFFNNRLQLNVAAYYYDYENKMGINSCNYLYLQEDIDNDGEYDDSDPEDYDNDGDYDESDTFGSSPDSNAKGVGDYEQYGLDLDATILVTNNDRLNLSVSYTHGEFTDLYFDYIDETNHPELILEGLEGTPDLSYNGKPNTNSPEWAATLGYSHNFALWNGGTLTPRLDARYKSEYILTFSEEYMSYDLTTTPPTYELTDLRGVRKQEAYYTFDISTVYSHPDGAWSVTGYVKNVTDYAVKTSWTSMGSGGSLMLDSPRTWGVVVSMKF